MPDRKSSWQPAEPTSIIGVLGLQLLDARRSLAWMEGMPLITHSQLRSDSDCVRGREVSLCERHRQEAVRRELAAFRSPRFMPLIAGD